MCYYAAPCMRSEGSSGCSWTGIYIFIYNIILNYLQKYFETPKYSLSEVHFNTGRLLFEFNGSSAALQLDKSSWPSQILSVYRLGKVSTTPGKVNLHAWCLSGPCYRPSLLEDRPFSTAASVCISREAWKPGSVYWVSLDQGTGGFV